MTLTDALCLLWAGWSTPEEWEAYQKASRVVRLRAAAVYKAQEIEALEKRLSDLKEGK